MLSSKKQKSNPFQPGYGVMPPLLAGRNRLKQNFRDRLASIRNHECNPTAIVLMGPRGCGKTALLEWVSREAKGHKLPVVKLTKEDFVSITELQQVLYNLDMPVDRLKKISVQGRLGDPEGIAGIQADYTQQSERSRSVNQKLVEGLTRLSRKGLVLLVDEAHDMPPEVGKFFYDTTQYVGLNHPIMLVIAGTPDLKIVFACSHATFSERAQIERIGRLTKDEAREALTEPFSPDISFLTETLGTVLAEAQNYPYFIQLWGRALWDVVTNSPTPNAPHHRVRVADVEKARTLTAQSRWELYSNRVEELRSKNLLIPIAEMAWRLGPEGQPTRSDFAMVIQHLEFVMDQTMAQQYLLHTGFIWEAAMGQWEYGIPSLAIHVREESVQLLLEALQGQGSIHALNTVTTCFGPPVDGPMEILTDQLLEALPQPEGETRLHQLQAMNLLVPSQRADYIRLMAPHLVEAILAEAKVMNLVSN